MAEDEAFDYMTALPKGKEVGKIEMTQALKAIYGDVDAPKEDPNSANVWMDGKLEIIREFLREKGLKIDTIIKNVRPLRG
jgi:hypothetical protein